MTISTSGHVVFCGAKNGIISVRRVWDLEGVHTFDTSAHGAVTSMTLVSGDFLFYLIMQWEFCLHIFYIGRFR